MQIQLEIGMKGILLMCESNVKSPKQLCKITFFKYLIDIKTFKK